MSVLRKLPLFIILLMTTPIFAVDFFWSLPESNSWHDANNWDPNFRLPSSSDNVWVNQGEPNIYRDDANAYSLLIGWNEGTSASLRLTNGKTLAVEECMIACEGQGTFNQESGSMLCNYRLCIWPSSTGYGQYNLTGGSVYCNSNFYDVSIDGICIGNYGVGTFIQQSGYVCTKKITLNGTYLMNGGNISKGDYDWFIIYLDSFANFEIHDGCIGSYANPIDILHIGYSGDGYLYQAGGSIYSSVGHIGCLNPPDGTGVGEYILSDGYAYYEGLTIGLYGEGYMEQNGGQLDANVLSIGWDDPANGILCINGGISNINSIYLADYSTTGTININGGDIKIDNFYTGDGSWSFGISGGIMEANSLYLLQDWWGYPCTLVLAMGNPYDGSDWHADMTVHENCYLEDGNVYVSAYLMNPNEPKSWYRPKMNDYIVVFHGFDSYDINVAYGTNITDGYSMVDPNDPNLGFRPLFAGRVEEIPKDPNHPNDPNKYKFVVVYQGATPGDCNGDWIIDANEHKIGSGDGKVSAGDLAVLTANWNNRSGTMTWADGDFNGDGNVTAGDLGILSANWGWNGNNYPGQEIPYSGRGDSFRGSQGGEQNQANLLVGDDPELPVLCDRDGDGDFDIDDVHIILKEYYSDKSGEKTDQPEPYDQPAPSDQSAPSDGQDAGGDAYQSGMLPVNMEKTALLLGLVCCIGGLRLLRKRTSSYQ